MKKFLRSQPVQRFVRNYDLTLRIIAIEYVAWAVTLICTGSDFRSHGAIISLFLIDLLALPIYRLIATFVRK